MPSSLVSKGPCVSWWGGGSSEGPQTARLAAWPSEGTMDSGLGVAWAIGAAKVRIVEGCLAIVDGAAGQGLVELFGCTVVGR